MADDNNFFKKEETTEEKPEGQEELSDKVTVGDDEFSQDELQKMVGLGKVASELEDKWNTKIDRLFPEFTKLSQEKKDWAKEKEEFETKAPAPAPTVAEEGGDDELEQAVTKLKELGFVRKDDIDKEVSGKVLSVLSAKELLEDTQSLVKKQTKLGNPKLSSEELLGYMEETGIKDPGFAYRMKFEKELDEIKEKKLSGIKPKGLVTEEAGGGEKVPQAKPITRHNISEALTEVLEREK